LPASQKAHEIVFPRGYSEFLGKTLSRRFAYPIVFTSFEVLLALKIDPLYFPLSLHGKK